MMVEDRYLSLGVGGTVSMCCPLGISEVAFFSWQDGSQGIPSTGVDCHGSGKPVPWDGRTRSLVTWLKVLWGLLLWSIALPTSAPENCQ